MVTREETMSEAIHYDRRRFIETAVMATAGAGLVGSRSRQPGSRDKFSAAPAKSTNGSLRPGKQFAAGDLDIGYTEAGASNGPPTILLHGLLHDVSSHVDVAALAGSGYRVIVPYVRGARTRRLFSSDTIRNGQAIAGPSDVIALMDALKIEKALVGGFDSGARTAEVMAALWPQRVKEIAPTSSYAAVSLTASQRPLPPKEELEWWYQYYFVRD
jgi:pimeloyl-ACP methyl ester carboxylesterase